MEGLVSVAAGLQGGALQQERGGGALPWRWAGQGRGRVDCKSRCPLAQCCRGHQHFPVRSWWLAGSIGPRASSAVASPLHPAQCRIKRSSSYSLLWPLCVDSRCASAATKPALLRVPRCAPSSATLRRAAWDNAAMVRRDRLRRWVRLLTGC